jgi:alpha-beta hydrolase superfamily lysophospholipase
MAECETVPLTDQLDRSTGERMYTDSYVFDGAAGRVFVRRWGNDAPRFIALVSHGYGEHSGRYEPVAAELVAIGATVYAPDHSGHGESDGERALLTGFGSVVDDLNAVAVRARADHPGLPAVLIGHSMGGLIATLFAQKHGDELAALVLSGPVVGSNPGLEMLLAMDPIPDVPIDPSILSRDPAVGAAYAADPLVYHGPFRRETLSALVAGVGEVAAGRDLGDLPTLWIHGAADQLVPYDTTSAAMEHLAGTSFEHTKYEGAAHEVFNETNRAEVLGDVTSFIERTLKL